MRKPPFREAHQRLSSTARERLHGNPGDGRTPRATYYRWLSVEHPLRVDQVFAPTEWASRLSMLLAVVRTELCGVDPITFH